MENEAYKGAKGTGIFFLHSPIKKKRKGIQGLE